MKLLILTQTVDANDPVLGFFVEWIRAFAAKCERVTVIARRVGPHDLPPNVRVLSMGGERDAGKIRMLWNFWRHLAAEHAKHDAVFVHMAAAFVLYGLPITLWHKRPAVLWYAHKSVSPSLRIATRFVSWVATASETSFRITTSKKRVIGHGIPASARMRKPSGTLRLLSVGRLSPVKRHDVAIRAFAEVFSSDANTTLTVVGAAALESDRPHEAELRALCVRLGVEKAVTFAGGVRHAEMADVYAVHDLLVHASETGSLDKVVPEALAAGLGVLTSSEAFEDFPEEMRFSRDDVHGLARKIEGLRGRLAAGDGVLRDEVRQWLGTHGLDDLVDKALALLRETS